MATTTSAKVKAVDAAYYTVKDLDKQTQFYRDLLGFEPTLKVPDVVSEWTFPGESTFGLYKSDTGQSSGSGVMFAVEDVEKAVADCKTRGVKFEDGGKVMDNPGCQMAFATDPEGLFFILHHRKDGSYG
jgi:catechol 2,3-dioxygenase-like lactoylglutathione lyase family enzyme